MFLRMIRYGVASFAFLTSCVAHALGGAIITFSGALVQIGLGNRLK